MRTGAQDKIRERNRSRPKGIDTSRSRRPGSIYTNTLMSASVQTHPTAPFTLSAADEALAVRLEAHDDAAWRGLLGSVEPAFGDPVAAQVAAIMQRRVQDGVEYRDMGDMIRQMLHTKAHVDAEKNTARTSLGCDMCNPYGTPGQMHACDDCSIPCPGCSGGYEDDGYDMTQRFLNGLSKERLIELILMTEEQRDHALYKGAGDMLTLAEVD